MAATKTYTVLHPKLSYGKADENGKILVKPRDYEAGDTVELDDDDAKPLLVLGAIEPETKSRKYTRNFSTPDDATQAEALRERRPTGGFHPETS